MQRCTTSNQINCPHGWDADIIMTVLSDAIEPHKFQLSAGTMTGSARGMFSSKLVLLMVWYIQTRNSWSNWSTPFWHSATCSYYFFCIPGIPAAICICSWNGKVILFAMTFEICATVIKFKMLARIKYLYIRILYVYIYNVYIHKSALLYT